jgi:hypothetical protein
MEGVADPTWGEAFEAAPLSDEEELPDPYVDEEVDAAFYDPLSEAALVGARASPLRRAAPDHDTRRTQMFRSAHPRRMQHIVEPVVYSVPLPEERQRVCSLA